MKGISFITSLFTEKKCYSCGQLGHFFCPTCNQNIQKYEPYCYVCKKKSDNFSIHPECQKYLPLQQIIVLTRYRNASIKKLLRHAKYYGKHSIYDDIIFSNAVFFENYISGVHPNFLPIPMHFLRRWKRGYNQSQKISSSLQKILDIPVDTRRVYKKRYTPHQSHLGKKEREKNIQDSFSMGAQRKGKDNTVYIVDDVISTGSTIKALAQLLSKNGYTDIRAIAIASD